MNKLFNQRQLAITLLGILALPFVVFGVLLLRGDDTAFLPMTPAVALHAYSMLCATFFAGIQWGVHFCKRTEDSVYLLSFATVVLAWVSLLAPGTVAGLAVMLLTFLLSLAEEYRLSRQRVTTAWFWRVRCISMALIVATLLLAISVLAGGEVS